jgi:DNA-binding transcriptional ArsR family regulator
MSEASINHTFIALSDPTRRGVVELLRGGPLRAGELADALDMNKPAMTRHLRVLRESGLVHEEGLPEDARVRVYRLRRAPFADLREWLDEVEASWALQLESFKRHAERTRKPSRRRSS